MAGLPRAQEGGEEAGRPKEAERPSVDDKVSPDVGVHEEEEK